MAKRIAVEIGGTKLQAALGNDTGRIETIRRASVDPQRGSQAILEQIAELVRPLLSDAVERVGIGFGGPVDREGGRIVRSFHVAGWDGFALAGWAEEALGRPAVIENDTNCGGLAEATVGAGQGGRCVLYSNIGSGIGGALVVDGRLHNGRFGAMEIGHTKLWDRQQNRYVIVEELCSGWALDRRARALAQAGQLPGLLRLADGDATAVNARLVGQAVQGELRNGNLSDEALERLGREMDQESIDEAGQLLDELTGHYAVAVANAVALLNPDRIVIGGGVSLIGQPLFRRLEARLREVCFAPYRDNWQLQPAQLGEDVVLVGTLLL